MMESSVSHAGLTQDVSQIFFTNLQLLGFDATNAEKKYHIPFNREMFKLPNKHGFEVVIHFLFSKLSASQCQERFRDCWPVYDKKQEQQFRKVCCNWLTQIAKEDPDAYLPRVSASTFMSPGGVKFCQMLCAFSTYVLTKAIRQYGGKKVKDFPQRPTLTSQGSHLSAAVGKSVMANMIWHKQRFLNQAQQTVAAHQEWKKHASEMVKEYRRESKLLQDRETKVREEMQKAAERGASRGSPGRRRALISEYDYDVQSVKRAQRVQKVRDYWKQLEKFIGSSTEQREIIESILERTLEKYRIDGDQISVKVPDMLLRECGQEIQRRNIDNVYQGGKLNLPSLLHLWNLSLHLYIEKLHQVGVPDFEAATPMVTTQVHTHQAHLTNAQQLRTELKNVQLPTLKASIERLRGLLDGEGQEDDSTLNATSSSLGLDLIPPTPPVHFTAEGPTPKGVRVPTVKHAAPPTSEVLTPELVTNMMDSISQSIRSHDTSLTQGSPVYAPRAGLDGRLDHFQVPHSKLPKRSENVEVERYGQKQRTRFRSAPSDTVNTKPLLDIGQGQVKVTPSGTTLTKMPTKKSKEAKGHMTAQVIRHKPAITEKHKTTASKASRRARRTMAGVELSGHLMKSDHGQEAFLSKDRLGHSPPLMDDRKVQASARNRRMPASGTRQSREDNKKVDKIATKLFTDDLLGEDGFVTRDKLKHSPIGTVGPAGTINQESEPPNGRLAHDPGSKFTDNDADKIVAKLFSDECLDAEDHEEVTFKNVNNNFPNSAKLSKSIKQIEDSQKLSASNVDDLLGLGIRGISPQNFPSVTEQDLIQFSLSDKNSSLRSSGPEGSHDSCLAKPPAQLELDKSTSVKGPPTEIIISRPVLGDPVSLESECSTLNDHDNLVDRIKKYRDALLSEDDIVGDTKASISVSQEGVDNEERLESILQQSDQEELDAQGSVRLSLLRDLQQVEALKQDKEQKTYGWSVSPRAEKPKTISRKYTLELSDDEDEENVCPNLDEILKPCGVRNDEPDTETFLLDISGLGNHGTSTGGARLMNMQKGLDLMIDSPRSLLSQGSHHSVLSKTSMDLPQESSSCRSAGLQNEDELISSSRNLLLDLSGETSDKEPLHGTTLPAAPDRVNRDEKLSTLLGLNGEEKTPNVSERITGSDKNSSIRSQQSVKSWLNLEEDEEELLKDVAMPSPMMKTQPSKGVTKDMFMLTLSPEILEPEMRGALGGQIDEDDLLIENEQIDLIGDYDLS